MSNYESYAGFHKASSRLLQAIAGRYMPRFQALYAEHDIEGWDVQVLQMAKASEPKDFQAGQLQARIPYMAIQTLEDQIEAVVARGQLRRHEDGYRLTEAGREVVEEIGELVEGAMADAPQAAAAEELVALLGRVAGACHAQEAIDAPCIAIGKAFMPAEDAAPLAKLRRHLQDLYAYRDDAHVAAWRSREVAGAPVAAHAWEAFSHIWGREVWGDPISTAAQAAEKLGFRGYDEPQYAAALDGLVTEGWLAREGEAYALTAAGRELREATEQETDQNYYAPWPLSESEVARATALMTEVAEVLEGEEA